MYYLSKDIFFPPASQADSDGILAIGGDLSPDRLMLAYNSGIFPWFNPNEPIIWWSPNQRMVLFLDQLKISKSLRTILNRNLFEISYNQNFRAVISNCQQVLRDGQTGTWITNEMIEAYCKLNELGLAKSIEVWQDNQLVGGLYGVDLGHVFCGESMFSLVSNASKVAFVALVNLLKQENYRLLDCQVYNDHLASLGCEEIERNDFLNILKNENSNFSSNNFLHGH
jgi:leucyl/phenylalanyl-tRNA--protein transferase